MRTLKQALPDAAHLESLGIPSGLELPLLQQLRDCPWQHSFRYTDQARAALLEDLFHSLACNKTEYLHYFFPGGVPIEGSPAAWNLSQAQGAVEGAEYSTVARGKPCGHIFKSGEATYLCK